MEKKLVFGHKNPDTDTICSAICLAYLKQQIGEEVEAVRLGELNEETTFVLEHFQQPVPRIIQNVAQEAKFVILVDHNERAQSADGIEDVEVLEVIDHHRIANFETSGPLYYRSEPVGCTATILTKMFRENLVAIPPHIAGLLVSAIISDTLLFKSPTSTPEDEEIAKELAALAKIDLLSYGLEQLKAGASITGKTPEELIAIDSKPFEMANYLIEIAQISVVEIGDVLKMKAQLETAMRQVIEQKKLNTFLVLITDVLHNNSVGLVIGEQEPIEKAFQTKVDNNLIDLPGVVSRKKQVVPLIMDVF